MAIVTNTQSFEAGASGIFTPTLISRWKTGIDTVLLSLGRDITLHLSPTKMACPDPSCTFNSSYMQYIGAGGTLCLTCAGKGFIYEPRQTLYTANIRWINEPLAGDRFVEESIAGRIFQNIVRTKTVIDSFDHINESVGATIDGLNVEIFREPRKTSFVDPTYVVTFWKRVDK
jgi:hypothetical protein